MKYLLLALCCFFVSMGIAQQRFDVVIEEIMSDPSPQVSLPNAEFVELKNTSGKDVNLQGFRLSTSTALSGSFPSYVLAADSFVILCSNANAAAFAVYGKALGIPSFPSLPNDGTTLGLLTKENALIHFVSYTNTWYQSELKKEGGWSLEMIDTHNPCAGISNWKASTDNRGGSPGKKNSVDALNKDETAPQLVNLYLKDNSTLVLQFDEPVDSALSAIINNYLVEPAVSISSVRIDGTSFTQIEVYLANALKTATLYKVSIKNLKDCTGNEIVSDAYSIGIPQEVAANDLVVNEILFNPKPNAADYVELYNRSNKIIDASKLYIASRSASGSISSPKKISEEPRYILPGDYVVITEDASAVLKNYLVKNRKALFELPTLPSWPDDKGTVVLLDVNESIADEVTYSDDWQFDLLADDEGVALERIDVDGPSQNRNNWHSAASTAGFGTPTYQNSQYKSAEALHAVISVVPKIFSPDNDGFEDFSSIQYEVKEPGFVANVLIFDIAGKMVRHLAKNATLGLKGSWNWDGLDEKGLKLPIGNYVIYTELFNLQGNKKSFKNVVTLARRLN